MEDGGLKNNMKCKLQDPCGGWDRQTERQRERGRERGREREREY